LASYEFIVTVSDIKESDADSLGDALFGKAADYFGSESVSIDWREVEADEK
jgi:hypothetical protein